MNILAISSIFPVPGIIETNDFILQTYINYLKLYEQDSVVIVVPLRYNLNPFSAWKRNKLRNRLKKNEKLFVEGFQVEIFRFISSWSMRNLHAIVTRSIFYMNRIRIKRLFSIHNFDIIHAQYIFSDGILAQLISKKYKIPYIVNTHNERFYFEHFISRYVALRVLKNASIVLPINYSNYLYYKSLGVNNIEQNTLGYNKDFIRPQKTAPGKSVSIFTVAELIKLKNIDKVILALEKLMTRYEITYTIIGKGPEKDHLASLVEKMNLKDKIFFVEYIPHDQIANEMYKHDIFVMPSYFETFGRVYFEVMAMGIPIICAKNSGIYGLFKNGEEGIAVDHQNIVELEESLEHLIDKPEERLRIGKRGQELVMKYTWENIVKVLNEKYLNSISGKA